MSRPTVLVVEDEASFVEALPIGLDAGRLQRRGGDRRRRGARDVRRVQPDLVLLDVMLPQISGIDVCRQLRKRSQVPIIMVTAKGAEIDTVVGLEVGADDYVTKPYRDARARRPDAGGDAASPADRTGGRLGPRR